MPCRSSEFVLGSANDNFAQRLSALDEGQASFETILDSLDVPAYLTDPQGLVTYWNGACVRFAGRKPELGGDRWCVTWRLYSTSGEAIAHVDCPMAVAIKEQRPVRGEIAIAERPDGSRVAFTPFPTPLYDVNGDFIGGINLLIDVSSEQAVVLSAQAARCRRLGHAVDDPRVADVLLDMAKGYEQTAAALSQR